MPHGTATYGAIIRKARLSQRRSLADIAEATGLSATFLSRLERGERRELTLSNAAAICDALGLPLDRLAHGGRIRKK